MNFFVAQDKQRVLNLIEQIDGLLDSGDYDWAEDTLTGIRGTVERNGYTTERQEQAVQNIEDGGGNR